MAPGIAPRTDPALAALYPLPPPPDSLPATQQPSLLLIPNPDFPGGLLPPLDHARGSVLTTPCQGYDYLPALYRGPFLPGLCAAVGSQLSLIPPTRPGSIPFFSSSAVLQTMHPPPARPVSLFFAVITILVTPEAEDPPADVAPPALLLP